jgi:hypothetical protein
MARYKNRDLDQWATAMGVTNDDEAIRLLTKTLVMVKVAQTYCADIVRATRSGPDDSVYRSALTAQVAFISIEDQMRPIFRAFRRHSRGR